MMNLPRSVEQAFKMALLGLLLIVCLGSEYLHRTALPWQFLNQAQAEVFATFQAADLQWLLAFCISVYFVGFIWLLRTLNPAPHSWRNVSAILILLLYGFGSLAYASQYQQASKSTDTLLLCFGLTLLFGFRFWRAVEAKRSLPFNLAAVALTYMLILLSIAAVWQPESVQSFQYRGQTRWSGLWGNPNTFGMLMGVGLVLAIGSILSLVTRRALRNVGLGSGVKRSFTSPVT